MPKVVLLYFDETQNVNVNENLLIHACRLALLKMTKSRIYVTFRVSSK